MVLCSPLLPANASLVAYFRCSSLQDNPLLGNAPAKGLPILGLDGESATQCSPDAFAALQVACCATAEAFQRAGQDSADLLADLLPHILPFCCPPYS